MKKVILVLILALLSGTILAGNVILNANDMDITAEYNIDTAGFNGLFIEGNTLGYEIPTSCADSIVLAWGTPSVSYIWDCPDTIAYYIIGYDTTIVFDRQECDTTFGECLFDENGKKYYIDMEVDCTTYYKEVITPIKKSKLKWIMENFDRLKELLENYDD